MATKRKAAEEPQSGESPDDDDRGGAGAPRANTDAVLAAELSRDLNASGREKRPAERYAPPEAADVLPLQEKRRPDANRRSAPTPAAAPKGQKLVGTDLEIYWVISPDDGEQRPATEEVVGHAIGPAKDQALVGSWHTAKVLRAKGAKVELRYVADGLVHWCNLYGGSGSAAWISPLYFREPGAEDETQGALAMDSLVVGGVVPEQLLKAFVDGVSLSQSTLRTYSNCIREIIRRGALFGIEDGTPLAAESVHSAVAASERNRQTSRAHQAGRRKFLEFLAESSGVQAIMANNGAPAIPSTHRAPKRARKEPMSARGSAAPARATWACGKDALPEGDLLELGGFERRRKGSSTWEPYTQLILERHNAKLGLRGLFPVAHVQRDAKAASKVWLFAQEGETIRGRLPWNPTVCPAALAKGCNPTAKQGWFYVSVGVLSAEELIQASPLIEHLPWERHSLTAFAQQGQGSSDTPAPKRRALLVSCEAGSSSQQNLPFTYQPHRSGGQAGRPNLSMTTKACSSLGEHGQVLSNLMDALCKHNVELGFPDSGLACVTNCAPRGAAATVGGQPVLNIGEGLAYCGGEELKWHHDGNQILDWLTQNDVLSSFILHCDGPAFNPAADGAVLRNGKLPPILAIKPHDVQWPQVRLHPPAGSKLDLVGTGKIAEHARKPVSKSKPGSSLLVFVGRRMVDEGLTELPEMAQQCPWNGAPVPQPLSDVIPIYGPIPGVTERQVFDSIAAIQRVGSHAHVGFHGRAVSSTMNPTEKSPIARGVQSVIHYSDLDDPSVDKPSMHYLDETGDEARFCVYSTPRKLRDLQGDALAFALSGAAASPIQYFISGRQGSVFAPERPGELLYHGIFYVHDWKWVVSGVEMEGSALRRDHCNPVAAAAAGAESPEHDNRRWHMVVKLRRAKPKEKLTKALLHKMVTRIGEDSRAAADAERKAKLLSESVQQAQRDTGIKAATMAAAGAAQKEEEGEGEGDEVAAERAAAAAAAAARPRRSGPKQAAAAAAAATTAATARAPASATNNRSASEAAATALVLMSSPLSGGDDDDDSNGRSSLLSPSPRGRPAAVRGVINKRRLSTGETEYKVLKSDDTVLWLQEAQLDPQLLKEFTRKREEKKKKRRKAEKNQTRAERGAVCGFRSGGR